MDCKGCDRISENCNPPFRCYGYLPKEKPMKDKVIFESEEEIRNIWKYFLSSNNYEEFKDRLNEHGYIRKSPVEEAEEMYSDWDSCGDKNGFPKWELEGIVKSLYEAVQFLKAENDRLKK